MRLLAPASSVAVFLVAAGLRSTAGAIEIEYSNPWYRVFNGVTESKIGEAFATFAVMESRTNMTGDLSLASDLPYATAQGYSDAFSMEASSSVDGSELVSRELDSVASEGNARFETDFRILSGDARPATLEISYSFEVDLVSSDPTEDFGAPGTRSGSHLRSIRISEQASANIVFAANLQPGLHVASARDGESGTLYWSEWGTNQIHRSNLDGSQPELWSQRSERPWGLLVVVPEPGFDLLWLSSLCLIALCAQWRRSSSAGCAPRARGRRIDALARTDVGSLLDLELALRSRPRSPIVR